MHSLYSPTFYHYGLTARCIGFFCGQTYVRIKYSVVTIVFCSCVSVDAIQYISYCRPKNGGKYCIGPAVEFRICNNKVGVSVLLHNDMYIICTSSCMTRRSARVYLNMYTYERIPSCQPSHYSYIQYTLLYWPHFPESL